MMIHTLCLHSYMFLQIIANCLCNVILMMKLISGEHVGALAMSEPNGSSSEPINFFLPYFMGKIILNCDLCFCFF